MKNKKLFIDILLFLDLIFAFISGMICTHSDAVVWLVIHVVSGAAFIILLAGHLSVNGRGWFDAGKKLFAGERYKKVRSRYIVDWLLLIIWGVSMITGFTDLDAKISGLHAGHAHSAFSVIGTILIGIHIFHHTKQIKAYFTSSAKNQLQECQRESSI